MSNTSNTMELGGYLFEVAGSTTDFRGNATSIPGKCLGKAPKTTNQNTRSGCSVASALTPTVASAPTESPAPQLTEGTEHGAGNRTKRGGHPAVRRSSPHARRSSQPRGDYRHFRQKPPPLIIVNEPWTAANWAALIVVLALVVAGIWLSNVGAEQRRFDKLDGAYQATQRR
ncbi:MAG: hypothetical protein WCJ35_03345 [Planctomycetota bacterium]